MVTPIAAFSPFVVKFFEDGTNNPDAARDFSVGDPVEFVAVPGLEELWRITQLVIVFVGGPLNVNQYSNIGFLSYGVRVFALPPFHENQNPAEAFPGINTTEELATVCSMEVTPLLMGKTMVRASYNFETPLPLERTGSTNGVIKILLNDDFSGLSFQEFRLHGSAISNAPPSDASVGFL